MDFHAATSDQKKVYNDLIKPYTPYFTYQWLMRQNHRTIASISSYCLEMSIKKADAFFEIYDAVKVCKVEESESINVMLGKLISILNNNMTLFSTDCTDLQNDCQPLKKYLSKAKELQKGKPIDVGIPVTEDEEPGQTEFKTEEAKKTQASYSLDRNTPTFANNKNENVRNWLFLLESQFVTRGIPISKRIDCVTQYLREPVLGQAIAYLKNKSHSDWDGFQTNFLIKKCEPVNLQRNLRASLNNLKQTGSVEEYNRKFLDIYNQIDSMLEDDALLLYTENLKGPLKLFILTKDPVVDELQHAMELTVTYEQTMKSSSAEVNAFETKKKYKKFANKGSTHNKKSNANGENSQKCYKCNIVGHKAKECRTNMDLFCLKCKKYGHTVDKCRSAKKKSKKYSRQVNATETVQSNKSIVTAEMNAAEIYSIELENEVNIVDNEKAIHNVTEVDDNATDLVIVKVEVKNKKYTSYAKALMDGGSTISTANEKFVKENKILQESSDCVIKTVTGTGLVKGKTEQVRIILFKNFIVHVRLFIIETKHDIIIGNNILKALNCMVGYSDGQVAIKIGNCCFLKHDSLDDYYLENNNIEMNECGLNYEYDLFSTNVDQDGLKIESEFDFVLELKNHPNVKSALVDDEVSEHMKKIIKHLSRVTAKKLTDLKKCMNHETKETYKIGINLLNNEVVNEPGFRRSELEKNVINSKVAELLELVL